uniref:Small ribosomal subunit protein uS15c n=1 Tax=Spirogyra maxima TaxID=3180 RepID=A0A191T4K1_SPIMX|nr:ribosomal protein S15 [Spirogyra maxima]ANI25323.1 ribosomal protein S15 [Spirogyra maxima]
MIQYCLLAKHSLFFEKQGSIEAQIASLTHRVIKLSLHLKNQKKDYASQRGLRKILGKRKRLLIYLLNTNPIQYEYLIKQLGIRGPKIESV